MRNTNKEWSWGLSWKFTKSCFSFFAQNKSLILIPFLSLLISFVILILEGFFLFENYFKNMNEVQEANQINWTEAYISFFILYFSINFISLFFNSALIACAIQRMQKQSCSIAEGLKMAMSRMVKIFVWSLINGSIGLVFKLLQRSHRGVRSLLLGTMGFSWAIVSYFVLPLIVIDDLNPWSALHQSFQAFKGNWRKMFSVFGLLMLLVILVFVALFGLAYLTQSSTKLFLILVGLFVFFMVIVGIVGGILESIVNSALYVEIFKKIEPIGLDKALLDGALLKKES